MKRLFAHIGFSVGVTLLAVNLMDIRLVPLALAGLTVMLTVSLLLSQLREAVTAPLCLSAAVFACLIYMVTFHAVAEPALSLDGKTADATGYVISLPEERDGTYYYTVRLETVTRDGTPQRLKVRLSSEDPLPADAYQDLKLNVSFRRMGSSAYSSYGYWGKGIFVSAEVNDCLVLKTYRATPMRRILHWRRDMIELFKVAVPGDAGALAAALITGDKSNLSDEAYAAFQMTAMSHLMAVSGLHLSVVVGGFYWLLKRSGLNRRSAVVFTLAVLLLYMALTGFSKSVLRAGVMLAVLLLGDMTERKGDTLNSLGLAVFIICLNPFAACDLSAILSVLAVLALTTLYPLWFRRTIKRWRLDSFKGNTALNGVKKAVRYLLASVTASVSVMLFTLPAFYLFFGWTTPMAIVGNLLLMPLSSADIVVSLLTYGANKLHLLAPFFNFICGALGTVILKIVFFLASHGIGFVFGSLFGLALGASLIIFGIAFMLHRRAFLRTAAVFCALLAVVTYTAEAVQYRQEAHICLCQGGAGALVYHDETIVWNVNSYSDYYTITDFIHNKGDAIDLLLCAEDGAEWSERLTTAYTCDTAVLTERYDGNALALPCRKLVMTDTYQYDGDGEITVDCRFGTGYYYINVNALDSTLTVGKNVTADADITVIGKKVKDANGIIRLRDGDVIYDIRHGRQYRARRADAWQ